MPDTTLKATQEAREEHDGAKERGKLGKGMWVDLIPKSLRKRAVPDSREAAGGKSGSAAMDTNISHFRLSKTLLESSAEDTGWIVDVVDRVRHRRASLAIQGNPLAGKPRTGVFPTAPTPERRARMANGVVTETVIPAAGPVQALKSHRQKVPMETIEKHLSEEEGRTYKAFLEDADMAQRFNLSRTTANYDGVPGGTRGPKDGRVPDELREKYALFHAVWAALEPRHKIVAYRMVLGLTKEEHEAAMTPAQYGKLASKFTDDQTAKGVTVGLVKATLWAIHHAYRLEKAKTGIRSSKEEIDQRRQDRREARGI